MNLTRIIALVVSSLWIVAAGAQPVPIPSLPPAGNLSSSDLFILDQSNGVPPGQTRKLSLGSLSAYGTTGPVAGVQFSGTPSAGQVLTATSPGAASWAFPPSGPGIATNSTNGISRPDGSTITISGGGVLTAVGGVSPANPTATAGPTAVNGSASTFMRSDAAPAVQTATNSVLGIVKPDGTTITLDNGVLSAMASGGDNICDPTNVMTCAAVKGASTSPLATDNALVVSLSPNSAGLIQPGQQTSTASAPVVVASDQSAIAVKFNTTPSLANGNGVVPTQGGAVLSTTNGGYQNLLQGNAVLSATNGLYANILQGNVALSTGNPLPVSFSSTDACQSGTPTSIAISQTSSTQLIAGGGAGTVNYICSIIVNGSDAENLSLVEGTNTGTPCSGSTVAIIGGTTAGNGMNFAANSGFGIGNGAYWVAKGTSTNTPVCLFQSGSGRVAGVMKIVQK